WGPTKPVAPVSRTFTCSNLRLVDPVRLVPLPSHHLDGAVHQDVVLEGPGDLAPEVAELAGGPQRVEVEDGVDPALAVGLLHTERDEPRAVDLAHVPEEFDQADGDAEGGEPAADLRQSLVEVGNRHAEGDRLALDLGDEEEVRHRQG